MKNCLACDSGVEPFVSFGRQPLANGFLAPEDFANEYFFELAAAFCPRCAMVQLVEQPAPEAMFHDAYAFFSGTSRLMAVHFASLAREVIEKYLTGKKDPFVVEIGCNDGILLRHFADEGIRHLGVEPSANVAAAAEKAGVRTLTKFFNAETARSIVATDGQADVFLAANCMCHIPFIHSIIDGITTLLAPSGLAIFEDPYLGDVLEKTSYDQIYDEHVFLFSAHSVRAAFAPHGMELVDVAPQGTHGGSMRYYLARRGVRSASDAVTRLLAREETMGIHRSETYARFRRNCEASRDALLALLRGAVRETKRIVGYAATSKSTTVINYCGITPELVEFIADTTPLKQGKFSPGMHIPVLPYERFKERYPDFALLFGWNHAAEILAKEKAFVDAGGRWITYVPRVEIVP